MTQRERLDKVIRMLLCEMSIEKPITDSMRNVFSSIPYNKLIVNLVLKDISKGMKEGQLMLKYSITKSALDHIKKTSA